MSDNLTEEQYDKVEQLIDEVCVASVIDGALNGAGEALHDELDKLDIDDDTVRQAVYDEIYVNRIHISNR
tara:strand:+ start:169 stop:378 length:210 start_codon:yes stop_codon:yes gene_type:complete